MALALGNLFQKRRAKDHAHWARVGALEESSLQNYEESSSLVDWAPLLRLRKIVYLCPSLEYLFGYGVLFGVDAILDVILIPLKLFAFLFAFFFTKMISVLGTTGTGFTTQICSAAMSQFGRREGLALVFTATAYMSFFLPGDSHLYATLYHWVRVQSTLKLYVLYKILDVSEKVLACFCVELCEAVYLATTRRQQNQRGQSLGMPRSASDPTDMIETPFFILSVYVVAAVAITMHTMTLLLTVVTLNAAVNSGQPTLFTLLILNNFVELKGIMWKKYSMEATFQIASGDLAERLQIVVFVVVILLQHLRSEGLGTLDPKDIVIILLAEVVVDLVKHYFISKFNALPVSVYRSFRSVFFFDVVKEKVCGSRLAALPIVQAPQSPIALAHESSASVDASSKKLAPSLTDAEYTSAGNTLLRNPSRRAGIFEYSYAALTMWSATPVLAGMMVEARFLSLLLIGICVVELKFLVSTTISGMALRFVCRTLLIPDSSGHQNCRQPETDGVSNDKLHGVASVAASSTTASQTVATEVPPFIGTSAPRTRSSGPSATSAGGGRITGLALIRDGTIAQLSSVQRFDAPGKDRR